MIKNVVAIGVIIILITGCQSDQVARLRQENKVLKSMLEDPRFLRAELAEINAIVNDIDASRSAIASDRRNITTFAEFKTRLNEIHLYIKQSKQKLQTAEENLTQLRNETSGYSMIVYALKGEVNIRDEDIVALSTTLKDFQHQNSVLIDSVRLQENRAVGLYTHLEDKQRTLAALEAKMIAMENDFKLTEAEVYYAKGQLLEESARKVRLAPQKRKQSYAEALELYRKAFALGKNEAAQNISILQQTLSSVDRPTGRKW